MKRLHVHVAVERYLAIHRLLLRAVRRPARRGQDGLRQMDARRSPREFRDLDARAANPASTISAFRSRTPDELHEVYARLRAGRRRHHRAGRDRLLLRQIGKVVDRRSRRHRLGNLPHHRRKHRLRRWHRREHSARSRMRSNALAAHRETEPAHRTLGLLLRVRHDGPSLQRPVPLHRQFGALDHGRGDPEQDGRGKIPRLQRRKPAEGPGPPAHDPALARPRLRHVGLSLEIMGRVRQAGRARNSISCSRSATTPRPKPARSGPASR